MNAAVPTPKVTFPEAFLKLQAAIKPAIKDATNPAFKSRYADLAAVWEAVKKPLTDNGFSVIQSPDFEGADMWLKTTILHVSGEKIEGRYPIRPVKQDPQGFGSAITYARRYSLSAMLGVIADEDDDGNAASAKGGDSKDKTPPGPQYAPDPDVIEGVKNWVVKQKQVIAAAGRLPDLYMWLDENGSDWNKPTSGSALDRLKRKAPESFKELSRYYQEAAEHFSKNAAHV